MTDPLKTIDYKGYKITIDYDPSPESPRECDDLSTIYSNSRRYDFDGHGIEELIQEVGGNVYDDVIPWDLIAKKYYYRKVWMYDHSGVCLKTGESNPWGNMGYMSWDSGLCGVIVVDKKAAKKEWPTDTKARAEKWLDGEIENLDTFCRGEIYGYEVLDEDGEEFDSCWGFYDLDECIAEAEGMVDYDLEVQEKVVQAEA
jgi:hypothetical protein